MKVELVTKYKCFDGIVCKSDVTQHMLEKMIEKHAEMVDAGVVFDVGMNEVVREAIRYIEGIINGDRSAA